MPHGVFHGMSKLLDLTIAGKESMFQKYFTSMVFIRKCNNRPLVFVSSISDINFNRFEVEYPIKDDISGCKQTQKVKPLS